MDFINQNEGADYNVEWVLITKALDIIGRPSVRDAFGISVLVLRAFVFGNPCAAAQVFTNLLRQTSFMTSFVVCGKIYGNSSSIS